MTLVVWAAPVRAAAGPVATNAEMAAPANPVSADPSAPVTPAEAPVVSPVSTPVPPAPPLPPASAIPEPSVAAPVAAVSDDSPPASVPWLGLPPLQVHAFVSQGFIKSTKNNYLVESKRGSFEFSEVGINFTQVLTDSLRTGIQLFARQLGKDGDFRARMDWFYLDYRFADWLGLRAGRTKIPFGLYNEVNDVDSARVPILLPQAVYPILNRNLLLAQTGLELYGYLRLGILGGFEYRLYGGTLYTDPPVVAAGQTLNNYEIPYLAGARLMWDTPVDGLRLGGNGQVLRFNTNVSIAGPAGMPPLVVEDDIPFKLWLASIEYTLDDLLLAGEYGRWHADVEITGLPIPKTGVTNQRFYGMAAYRITHWFTPGVYYSSLLTDEHKPMTRDNYQHDFAATLRFDINPYWLLKLEGHYIDGTTDLSSALNDGTPLNMLPRQWFLFLAKTTVYF